jgi:hypothetical protein
VLYRIIFKQIKNLINKKNKILYSLLIYKNFFKKIFKSINLFSKIFVLVLCFVTASVIPFFEYRAASASASASAS